ncbi:hypothetical protein [Dyella caseinilytica]|uniref:Uncharacterized protein n=1 Tax=Dyella caseinilytica TaxID=1849581 RepID=A0ABX7GQC6_9GAMM|nr:hypothetical protein [Dyella caseinilytica]QRN52261.1 hypothetical protein ISN74_12250 [Dyella caseinilytica]GGA14430.1 hypothetical protein GCM10011408_40240 [Dyella caseinilytica]
MNKTRYIFAMLLAVGIGTYFSSAHAGAAVVTRSTTPNYSVTTVRTTGSYVVYPAPCCYSSVVVRSVPSTVTVKSVSPPPPSVRVVYATPVVTTYPAPKVVYMPTTYYYVP